MQVLTTASIIAVLSGYQCH